MSILNPIGTLRCAVAAIGMLQTPRQHTLSVVLLGTATGKPQAADDAKEVGVFELWEIPSNLCFDHDQIMKDYWLYRNYGIRPRL